MRAALLLVVLASACWTGTDAVAPVAPPPPPPRAAKAFPRASTWDGWYVCPQGKTAVRVSLRAADGRAEGVFEFGPFDDNPGVPEGSFTLIGRATVDADGSLWVDLIAQRWIDQPTGYLMIGFAAASDGPSGLLRGTIDNENCGAIELRRSS